MVSTDRPTDVPSSVRTRVLVVDDEPSIRMVTRVMLERAGYAVEEAADAAEAVRRAAPIGGPFAAVLLDVSLPDRSGVEVLAQLRVLVPHVRVILMSGRAEADVPDHGADGYLSKPFSRDQLIAAVRAVTALAPQ